MNTAHQWDRTARVQLVDFSNVGERLELGRWLCDRRDRGDAVAVAVERQSVADALGLRAIALHNGRLDAPIADRARVAESEQRFNDGVFASPPVGEVAVLTNSGVPTAEG